MLTNIQFKNYRCFECSEMSLRDLTILVGKNNSGKSTIIEGLRMISMASKKCTKTVYINAPKYFGLPLSVKGFRLPVERLKIDLRSVVYYYQPDIAKIIATFNNRVKIVIYLNEEIAFATLFDNQNNLIASKKKAEALIIPPISILPQIGLIKENEKKLTDATVYEDMDTYLSSRHFRNEMLLLERSLFDQFKQLAETTWPGLRVRNLDYNINQSDYISLIIEDASFPGEIGLMGSGIQMWLQIIWFICRSIGCKTIILDEPDVYMHPDLQVKILMLVKSLFKQVIIATHSVEIISNVSPRNIVTIDKQDKQMKYANQMEAVQDIINDIGSVYNLSLIKLGSANKCLFVEGEDIKILQQFFNILNPNSVFSLDTIPCFPLGGFCNIKEAFGSAKFLHQQTGGLFHSYALLDRDYYLETQLEDLKEKAKTNHLLLHIWGKKEIENYIIKPRILFRLLNASEDHYAKFILEFESLVDSFRDTVIDSYTTKFHESNPGLAAGTAAARARDLVTLKWTTLDDKLNLVPGKELLSAINGWMNEKYKARCSMKNIFNVMKLEDVDTEIIEVLNQLMQ